jgi:toxin ParE1/3/4
MTHRVIFDPAAEADLQELAEWIAERANVAVAIGYVERIIAHCRRLDVFPMRGTARDDVLPGLRTVGFEHRVLIAFRVGADTVSVLRILYGGRDAEAVLRELD